jgi:hypothetical protein
MSDDKLSNKRFSNASTVLIFELVMGTVNLLAVRRVPTRRDWFIGVPLMKGFDMQTIAGGIQRTSVYDFLLCKGRRKLPLVFHLC